MRQSQHDCQFAWTAHKDEARGEGLSAEVIDIIRHRRPTDGLAEAEAALIDFGRELFGTHRVTPQTYARVAVLFERRLLVDVVNLMGMYAATAVLLIAFDAQLPEGVAPSLPPRSSGTRGGGAALDFHGDISHADPLFCEETMMVLLGEYYKAGD